MGKFSMPQNEKMKIRFFEKPQHNMETSRVQKNEQPKLNDLLCGKPKWWVQKI